MTKPNHYDWSTLVVTDDAWVDAPDRTKDCETCGREFTIPPNKGNRYKYCDLCRRADKHRNGKRASKISEMIVSVDLEGRQTDDGVMHIISVSYGREDGTSASLSNLRSFLTGQEVCMWLIENVSQHYTDSDNKEFKQSVVSFHFSWDTAVITKDFTDDLSMVYKATAQRRNLLCNTAHKEDAECGRLHRSCQSTIQLVMDDGEGDLLALHTPSNIGITQSVKRRLYIEHRPNGDRYDDHRRVDIHDTGSAFVGGLLAVIDKWKPELNAEQQTAIEWGKVVRKEKGLAGFAGATIADIERYSESECVAHARVVRLLINAIRTAAHISIKPSQLFGSGSVAAAACKFHNVPPGEDSDLGTDTPITDTAILCQNIFDVSRVTYFGGLIEAPVVGIVAGTVDELDINSAYPAQAVKLPCMRKGHGEWVITTYKNRRRGQLTGNISNDTIGYVLTSWMLNKESTSTGPFLVRRKDGTVRASLVARDVWVTIVEYNAAIDQFGANAFIKHSQVIRWQQHCSCPNPFAWLTDLYDARLVMKDEMKALFRCETCTETTAMAGGCKDKTHKRSLPAAHNTPWQYLNCRQEAIKLIINSCYGKLAQQRPTLGRYTNLGYAGFITGATRSMVRREAWAREAQGGTVVYQHTDSVLSIGGSPTDGGNALGAWGMEKPTTDFLIVQPGLAIGLGGGKLASRGARKDEFGDAAREWWQTQDFTRHPDEWEPMVIDREMMLSRKLAMVRNRPTLAGSFVPQPLTVHVASNKRDFDNAYQMVDNPTAWVVPPCVNVPNADKSTLLDLDDFLTAMQVRIVSGDFDHLTEPVERVDIFDDRMPAE